MYTLIGNGRVAKHVACYFSQLNIPFNQWYRSSEINLRLATQTSDHILLLISDSVIQDFIQQNDFLYDKKLVHFSGALNIEHVFAAHPLASFSSDLFELNFYRQIPFCIDAEGPAFIEILPGLPNPHFRIPRDYKALYHAFCVMSGNFTAILWQKFFAEMKNRWDVPREVTFSFLESVTKNLFCNSDTALTGPLARCDQITIEKNLNALRDDKFKKIYEAFVSVFLGEKNEHSSLPKNEK